MPALLVVISVAAVAMLAAGCATSKAEDRGRQLYAERGCAVCHGPAGRGDGPSAKRLNLPPRDFANVRGYRNGSSQVDIAASIRSGSGPGNAMPAFRDITDAEASDIAAWIVSLQHAGPSGGQP
jgi:mono/diheme cytochrome c family protein